MSVKKIACIFFLISLSLLIVSCETMQIQAPPTDLQVNSDIKPTYSWLNANVFNKSCKYCHSGRAPFLGSYNSIQSVVKPGLPLQSKLYFMVATERMPKGGKLKNEEKWAIYHWIKNGAKND